MQNDLNYTNTPSTQIDCSVSSICVSCGKQRTCSFHHAVKHWTKQTLRLQCRERPAPAIPSPDVGKRRRDGKENLEL